MTAREIEYAIAIVESSRKTHVQWARYRRQGGREFEGGGDLRFHEKCIRRYDHVLRILNLALFEATEAERREAYARLRALR